MSRCVESTARTAGQRVQGVAARGRRAVVTLLAVVLVVGGCGTAGCGTAPAPPPGGGQTVGEPARPSGPPAMPVTSPTVADPAVPPHGAVAGETWESPDPALASLFRAAARNTALTVYAPTVLPAGATLAPVPPDEDPAPGPGAHLRVVLDTDFGWLSIMEGMTGDLGDLPGDRCIVAGGRPGCLYRVLGGELVQWSDGGAWYGVYGVGRDRAAMRSVVLRVAEGMRPVLVGGGDASSGVSGTR